MVLNEHALDKRLSTCHSHSQTWLYKAPFSCNYSSFLLKHVSFHRQPFSILSSVDYFTFTNAGDSDWDTRTIFLGDINDNRHTFPVHRELREPLWSMRSSSHGLISTHFYLSQTKPYTNTYIWLSSSRCSFAYADWPLQHGITSMAPKNLARPFNGNACWFGAFQTEGWILM